MERSEKLTYGIIAVAVIALALYYGLRVMHAQDAVATQPAFVTQYENDSNAVRFDMEVYDAIQAYYWKSSKEYDLPGYFGEVIRIVTATTPARKLENRTDVARLLSDALATSTQAKGTLAVTIADAALRNLEPRNRSYLFQKEEEITFRESISNENPNSDFYGDIGLVASSTADEIAATIARTRAELQASTSPDAAKKLAEVTHIGEVLTDPVNRKLYDGSKIEPTTSADLYGTVLYLSVQSISPTSIIEIKSKIASVADKNVDGLIIDLRGNRGGAFDFIQSFLGLFVGPNQYAYRIFKQGNTITANTTGAPFGSIGSYKNIAVLTDTSTQSTAELIAATFKHLRLGTIIGNGTGKWGTIENTYPINTRVSTTTSHTVYLVNALTVDPTGKTIEGNGVIPDIDPTKSGWQKELPKFFSSPDMIKYLPGIIRKMP